MSNRIKLLGLGAIAMLTLAIVWTAAQPSGIHGGPDDTPGPTLSPPTTAPQLPPQPVAVTHVDALVAPGAPPSPTGDRAQSKLWVAGGSWWAAMVDPATKAYHIFQLVDGGASWADTGTLIDDRKLAQPDCLWDGKHLYIVSSTPSKGASGAARLLRYTFDTKSRRFALDPNFPITISATGIDSVVLAQDSTGKLWVAYLDAAGQVTINRTIGGDLFWGKPLALPAEGSHVTVDDIATIVAYGPGKVGVLWGNRADGAYYFSSHEDGDPDDSWSPRETAVSGKALANDQLKAVASPDGRVFALAKTALDHDPTGNGRSPQILLLIRGTDGRWTNTLYARLQDQVGSPLIAYDATAGIIYAMATTPKAGGQVAFKRTWPDDPTFEAGSGSPLVVEPTNPTIGAGTTTKGPVSTATGLVVLAWDATTGRYLHGVLDLGGGILAGPKPAAGATAGPQAVFADDFNPWPAGSHPATGWDLRSSDRPTAFVIKRIPNNPTRTNSAAIVTPAVNQDIRACKSFGTTSSGDVTVDLHVRLSRVGRSDAVLTEVRGGSVEAASIRVGQVGTFAYYNGAAKVKTTVRLRPGDWYRSVVVVHLANQTYDWRLYDSRGRGLIAVRGIRWRTPLRAPLDDVCLRTPAAPAGVEIDWDDVKVIR